MHSQVTPAERKNDDPLTHRIIGAAMEVHRTLGPGFLEQAYENALCIEMSERGLSFEKQVSAAVVYKDVEVAQHRVDLVVEDRVAVELKAIRRVDTLCYAQTRSYVQALGLEVGLLINFGTAPLEVRRIGVRRL